MAGAAVSMFGLSIVVVLQAALMLAVPLALLLVPPINPLTITTVGTVTRQGMLALVALPVFRRVVIVAALILGSHALHDTFAVIRWTNAGISAQTTALLTLVSG